MKKILSILLICMMCLSFLVACDQSDSSNPSDDTGNLGNQNQQNSNENDSSEDQNDDNNQGESSNPEDTLTKFEKQFSVENEKRLATILATPVSSGAVAVSMPVLSVNAKSRTNAGDGAFTYVYENASKALYDECCEKLWNAEYAQYTETEFNGTAYRATNEVKNYFTTFVSTRLQVDVGFHDAFSRMYVTVTPRANSELPLREAPTYTALGEQYPTLWTQYGLEDIDEKEASLGYIIRLADGSFLIFDSGEQIEGVEDRMYEILKMQAPDPDNIVISAWIFSHSDSDHVGGFIRFADQYGSDKTINLKQIVLNFPHDSNTSTGMANYQNTVKASKDKFWSNPTFLKPHTGNVLYYAEVTINVLYTQEDHLATEAYFGNYNTSSMVTQFIMGDGTKILIGADHSVDGEIDGYQQCEGALSKWYGSFLESYAVSVFHHGFGGGADGQGIIYGTIKPTIVLWPVEEYRITLNSLKTSAFNSYFTSKKAASRGVEAYYVAGDDMTILTFADGKAHVTQYDTFADYKAGIVKQS